MYGIVIVVLMMLALWTALIFDFWFIDESEIKHVMSERQASKSPIDRDW